MICDFSPAYIRAISPYLPGKPISELERELGISNIDKLASNENPRGPSPLALQAAALALPEMGVYPDGNGYELKTALAGKYGVEREQIVLGNGSNDVLDMAARAFLSAQSSAVYSQHAFAVYPLAVQAVGATGIETPAQDYAHDLHAMLAAVRDDTRVVFIANPNNPTGTFAPATPLHAFFASLRPDVLLVLDEAYSEYLPEEQKTPSTAWLDEFPNLLITRTFSKAYGLAGLRVGYGIARREVIELLNRVRAPFNVNSVALAAAAAALGDSGFVRESFELNRQGMAQISEGLQRLGVSFIPSFGNFVSVRVGDGASLYQYLLRQGVIVRPIASYGMAEFLRVTIGLPEQNSRFLAALEQGLKAVN
jgi:histidinol-phosphate aminotransferase